MTTPLMETSAEIPPAVDETVMTVMRALRGLGHTVKEMARKQLASPQGLQGPSGVHGVAAVALLSRLATDGELRCSDLADRLGLDVSVASRQLAVLDQQGLISRRPDPSDGRAWLNGANEQGQQLLARLRATWIRPLRLALNEWDDADLLALAHYLERLETDLHAAGHGKANS